MRKNKQHPSAVDEQAPKEKKDKTLQNQANPTRAKNRQHNQK